MVTQNEVNLIPAAVLTGVVSAGLYGAMGWIWLRNFGRRAKTKKD